MIIKESRVPGRTAEERRFNVKIIVMVALYYILEVLNKSVNFDKGSRAGSRHVETLYYRIKWREVKGGHGVSRRRLVLGF